MKNTKKSRIRQRQRQSGLKAERAEEGSISKRRLFAFIMIAAVFVAGTFLLCIRKNVLKDQIAALLALTVTFLLVFLLVLRNERQKNRLSYNATDYMKMLAVFVICFVIVFSGTFFDDFFFPIMPLAFILTVVMNGKLSLSMTIFFAVLFSLTQGSGIYAFLCYIILGTIGALIADYLRDEKPNLFTGLIIFGVDAFVPCLFMYLSGRTLSPDLLPGAFSLSLVSALLAWILFPKLVEADKREPLSAYDIILDDDYSLAQDIRLFSMEEYTHACRVRRAAENCAIVIRAKDRTAACGGFYYRLGVMEGEPFMENAVRIAEDHCFPHDVIQILSEYPGEGRLPTTIESAIVHMASTCVTRLENEINSAGRSEWNQSMIIYQAMNELSAKGVYDRSGMSINQFLRIRDLLAKTNIL